MSSTFSISPQLGVFGKALAERLKASGLVESSVLGNGQINFLHSFKCPLKKASFNILMLIEPKSVTPENYNVSTWDKFDLISALGKYRADKYGLTTWFEFPFDIDYMDWKLGNRTHTVMVNASKFSANRDSLYSLRREVLTRDSRSLKAVQLYGDNWNEPILIEARRRFAAFREQLSANFMDYSHFECWSGLGKKYLQHRGKMNEDFGQLRDAKLAVVIENEPDYISEKIWIHLNRGVIPIYVGPDLRHHSFICKFVFSAQPQVDEILDLVHNAGDMEIMIKIQNYIEFAKTFDKKAFLEHSVDNYLVSLRRTLQII